MIVAINERQWQGLVRALALQSGLAALEARLGVPFTGDDGVRFRNRDAIYALIDAAIGALPHAELAAKLDKDHAPEARKQHLECNNRLKLYN
jgi:2-methylfumaryl-CoA isomerase